MKSIFLRGILLSSVAAAALFVAACDDDDEDALPAAPREPTAAATSTPAPDATASPTARPTASPGGPQAGQDVGFLGRINSISTNRMRVSSFEVISDASTLFFRDGGASDFGSFSIGEDVRVAGRVLNDGTIQATKISLLPDPTPTPGPDSGAPSPAPSASPSPSPTATASPTPRPTSSGS